MTHGEDRWSRRRVVAVLAGGAAAALVLCAGLAYALWDAFNQEAPGTTASPASRQQDVAAPASRDEIAAAPFALAVSRHGAGGPDAFWAPVQVPAATALGPADVPTGYPRTPAGALGQLAAIDATVLTGMSLGAVHRVHAEWALPGAPRATDWVMARNVEDFLTAAAASRASGPPTVTVTPVAAAVKGTDGPGWAVVCALLRVQATLVSTASITYGHCERMAWSDGRWQIAPGTPPPPLRVAEPAEGAALEAGWRPWASTHEGVSRGTD
ncbi:hypothetical protein [Arthrobacter sp. NEB 688]|uniref:hypothetical protein n=1 Tax=Arthrobacter sp. NEB 688 TaxID=904039 RepID=UPI0015653435|nr:hypothetical protein [Arthrobacter sp. NEB 688]QKE85118.1 hypothetical protein HL663_15030 [Arthrobacter sp. NEB 688]